jgi:uncharacterized protein (TIGR00304 family)
MLESLAILFIFLGIVLILLGLLAREPTFPDYRRFDYKEEFEERRRDRKVRGAGIVMIGPIPIIFGDSRYAFYLGIIAIILMILGFLFMFFSLTYL